MVTYRFNTCGYNEEWWHFKTIKCVISYFFGCCGNCTRRTALYQSACLFLYYGVAAIWSIVYGILWIYRYGIAEPCVSERAQSYLGYTLWYIDALYGGTHKSALAYTFDSVWYCCITASCDNSVLSRIYDGVAVVSGVEKRISFVYNNFLHVVATVK